MKVEYYNGCTTAGVYIDNKALVDLSIEEQKDALLKVLNSLKNPTYSIQQFLINAVEEEGEYENLGMCEKCGDSIYNYKLICK